MRKTLILVVIVLLLASCAPVGTKKTANPQVEYYRGIYDGCIYAAIDRQEENPLKLCADFLKVAIDDDWQNGTWPAMPYLP